MSRRKAIVRGSFVAALLAGGAALAGPTASAAAEDLIGRFIHDNPAPGSAAPPQAATRPGPTQVPMVMGARIGEHADKTRFVIELSDPVQVRAFTLGNPNRVVIDMPAVQWHLEAAPRPTGHGAIRSYRFGQFRSGNSRFVVDLNRPVSVTQPLVIPPSGGFGYRVVLDFLPSNQDAFDRGAGWPADLRAREVAAETPATRPVAPSIAPTPEKHVVVIDAGHGGIDAGTTGINGLMEKDLVLDEAQRLAHEIARHPGYVVHLTRDSDIYIPLRERVNISRSYHADLFISLHADSNPDSSVSGLSIYTLSENGSDKEAAALARKENQSDVIAGVDLGGGNATVAPILIDLAQRDTMNRSSRFAAAAVPLLSSATDIISRDPHRSAGFAVLKAPDVPAVLIELGYLSNTHDAAQMNTTRWRAGVAGAIALAVDRYFGPSPRAANP